MRIRVDREVIVECEEVQGKTLSSVLGQDKTPLHC